MLQFLMFEPSETILCILGDALDVMDVGILLLDREMRVRFVNRRQIELFALTSALLATRPTFGELLNHAGANSWFNAPPDCLPVYLAQREEAVRAGRVPPTRIDLRNGQCLLFSCIPSADGGRILTYYDISTELHRATEQMADQMSAEIRFSNETLEEQASSLVALAEASYENAQAAEAARLALECEIDGRRLLEAQLRRAATIDGLTGVLNRAAFMAAAQLAMEQPQPRGQRLAVLMLDVDHFKKINDNFGHAGGDLALRHLVAALRSGIRPNDLLGRLGGEEFAIVLRSSVATVAEEVAERIRRLVATVAAPHGEKRIRITVSIGLAFALESGGDIEEVIARADAALYRAKGGGRNQVIVDDHAAMAWRCQQRQEGVANMRGDMKTYRVDRAGSIEAEWCVVRQRFDDIVKIKVIINRHSTEAEAVRAMLELQQLDAGS